MPKTSRTLVIETATEACSIALFEGTQTIGHEHREIGRGHAEMLVPMISSLPDKGRACRILVSLGPGSFTGVRIGIATARALGVAWQAEVLGYPTLALVAAMAQNESDRPVTVCMSGGHGEWFVQDFARGAMPMGDFASLKPADAAKRPVRGMIAGTKARELVSLHPADGSDSVVMLPNAQFVFSMNQAILRRRITPIYGRPPDAKPQAAPSAALSE